METHERQFVDWLKQKAAGVKGENIYECKSWLLTGASIYPNSISMKMACYKMAKQDGNVPLAANHLNAMVGCHASDSHTELQAEISLLLKAVQADFTSSNDKLNTEIFRKLPVDLQCRILKKMASTTEDVISKCSLLLLLIQTNANHAKEYGVQMVEHLFQAEITESPNNIRNVYRKYFVEKVLPLMLKDNPAGTDKKILLSWLDKAFQYYVVSAFQLHQEGMMSPPRPSTSAPLSVKESRPWESLSSLLVLTAQQIKMWNVNSDHFKSEELMMQYLNGLKIQISKEHSKTLKREFIYLGTYQLLRLIYSYNSITKKHKPACLVQRTFIDKLSPMKKGKKAAIAASETNHSVGAVNIPNGDSLVPVFKSACASWSLLHSDSGYSKAFNEFMDRLDDTRWRSNLLKFNRDRIVFQQEYKDYPIPAGGEESSCYRLQKACCQYALGMHREACQEIIDIITDEPTHSMKQCCCSHTVTSDSQSTDQFLFISESEDVFDSGISIVVSALKTCQAKDPTNNDIIGNLCVLSQLHWPKYKNFFFQQLIPKIKELSSFKFSCFFDYITNIEILEEFAYLKTDQGGDVNLQIIASAGPKSRTVTRGVSRDAQEDFKAAFEKQVVRSTECVQRLVIRFLIERMNEVLAPLAK